MENVRVIKEFLFKILMLINELSGNENVEFYNVKIKKRKKMMPFHWI